MTEGAPPPRGAGAPEQSVSLLRATLDATNDGILAVDLDGRVETFNRKFAELWRIPEHLLALGDDDAMIVFVLDQLVDPAAFVARVRDLYNRPAETSFDVLRFKDGRLFERSSQPQRQGEDIIGRVWSFRDVTEQRSAEAERDRLLARTQEQLRQRDEFLSVVSHELRTPLTSLKLGVQVLARFAASPGGIGAAPPEQVATALDTAVRQQRVLGRLVEELLSLARIRAGRLELRRDRTDLVSLVHDVLSDLDEERRRASCEITLVAPNPVEGNWDRARLTQVVTNLLTNAHRYAAGARIDLSVDEYEGKARLRVHDHGPGIAAEVHERIFERFERAAPPSHYGGLGLGLYIVRQLVEAHGGQVTVQSAPGEGTTFTVTLPRA